MGIWCLRDNEKSLKGVSSDDLGDYVIKGKVVCWVRYAGGVLCWEVLCEGDRV